MSKSRFKGWPVAELGAVTTINEYLRDVRLPPRKPLFSVKMVSTSPETSRVELVMAKEQPPDDNSLIVREGDVLLAKESLSHEKGRVAVVSGLQGGNGFVTRGVHVIRPGRTISAKWLWHLLRQPSLAFAGSSTTGARTTWNRLTAEVLQTLMVPLPPVAAQLKIVALLDEAEDARRLQAESAAETERALMAAFSEIFKDVNVRPSERFPLRSYIERIEKGGVTGAAILKRPTVGGEFGLLTPDAVASGRFLPGRNLALRSSTRLPTLRAVAPGDLLMVWMAAHEDVGATALVEDVPDGLFLPESMWRLVPRPDVNVHFLKGFLSAPRIHQLLRDLASGVTIAKLSPSRLLSLRVFMPPPAAQQRFADLYKALTEARAMQDNLGTELDGLLDAMLSRAYMGRPQTAAKARSKKAASKKKGSSKARKRAAARSADAVQPQAEAAAVSEAGSRIIWGKLSDFQRAVWAASLTFGQQFRVGDIMRAVKLPAGMSADRERFLSALDLLVSLGAVIKEGRVDADRWRRPDPESDQEVGL